MFPTKVNTFQTPVSCDAENEKNADAQVAERCASNILLEEPVTLYHAAIMNRNSTAPPSQAIKSTIASISDVLLEKKDTKQVNEKNVGLDKNEKESNFGKICDFGRFFFSFFFFENFKNVGCPKKNFSCCRT